MKSLKCNIYNEKIIFNNNNRDFISYQLFAVMENFNYQNSKTHLLDI